MGSSTSKPRKGHEKPKHLPKVGSPENLEWRHEGEKRDAFGSGGVRIAIAVLVGLAIIGLLYLTL